MTAPTVRAATIRGVFPFIGCDSGLPLAQSMTSGGTGNGQRDRERLLKIVNAPVNYCSSPGSPASPRS
jgi:hypothetical protein